MMCDIVIPVWNQLESTRECIEAIMRATKRPYRLILIDNGSDGETKAYLRQLKSGSSTEIRLIRNETNLGYVKAVNQGLKASEAPYVCIMNNDTIPGAGWLDRLISFAEKHPDIGLMNPLCNGHCERSIDEYAKHVEANGDRYMEMNQCFGFCTLIKRAVIDKIGYLDEVFGMGGYDDTDYSMRALRAGYLCASVHSAYVYHKEHLSFKAAGARDSFTLKGQAEYLKKWPRHLRIGTVFSIDKDVTDDGIETVLKTLLLLAREWCWVNLWIIGDEAQARRRIELASGKIGMPLHQNIKFNFIGKKFAKLQTFVRIVERAFGTKK
ncbi:MAG: glycosyltransferase family 2 protein, partial [Candidatus Omnitrophica bacterium]|nr:glycosyltransferase family 2 protein [Candidatus Omnitrophota bacterium]